MKPSRFAKNTTRAPFPEYSGNGAREGTFTGWEIAHFIVDWFEDLWRDKNVSRAALDEYKKWLAALLKQNISRGLLNVAVQDHLLSNKKMRAFFSDWKDDAHLHKLFVE